MSALKPFKRLGANLELWSLYRSQELAAFYLFRLSSVVLYFAVFWWGGAFFALDDGPEAVRAIIGDWSGFWPGLLGFLLTLATTFYFLHSLRAIAVELFGLHASQRALHTVTFALFGVLSMIFLFVFLGVL